mmetsp:Transcript_164554/g.527847  ORF Transcript_164554/g.527847 Transcript_164554/m.527847 type:complete len:114 (+) Transcript_164554:965-1306(+)
MPTIGTNGGARISTLRSRPSCSSSSLSWTACHREVCGRLWSTVASSDDSGEDEGSSDDLDGSTDDDPQQASLEDEGSSDDLDGSTDDDPQQASLEDRWRDGLPTGRSSSIPQV